MKNLIKRLGIIVLSSLVICCISIQAFASNTDISPQGIWGADKVITPWSSGTMTIYVSSYIPIAGLTLKTEALESGVGGGVDFKVSGPNGEEYVNYAPLGVNDEDNTIKLINATPGYYKISYHAIGDTGNVHIYAWIYG